MERQFWMIVEQKIGVPLKIFWLVVVLGIVFVVCLAVVARRLPQMNLRGKIVIILIFSGSAAGMLPGLLLAGLPNVMVGLDPQQLSPTAVTTATFDMVTRQLGSALAMGTFSVVILILGVLISSGRLGDWFTDDQKSGTILILALARLTVIDGPRQLKRRPYQVHKRLSIGRSLHCQLSIKDRTVSGTHAVIEFNNNSYMIRDCDSSNGTFLNEKRIEPRRPYPLNDGDLVKICNVVMRFTAPDTTM